jgi:hypothetical protein
MGVLHHSSVVNFLNVMTVPGASHFIFRKRKQKGQKEAKRAKRALDFASILPSSHFCNFLPFFFLRTNGEL